MTVLYHSIIMDKQLLIMHTQEKSFKRHYYIIIPVGITIIILLFYLHIFHNEDNFKEINKVSKVFYLY